jgi:hypothetical protein
MEDQKVLNAFFWTFYVPVAMVASLASLIVITDAAGLMTHQRYHPTTPSSRPHPILATLLLTLPTFGLIKLAAVSSPRAFSFVVDPPREALHQIWLDLGLINFQAFTMLIGIAVVLVADYAIVQRGIQAEIRYLEREAAHSSRLKEHELA